MDNQQQDVSGTTQAPEQESNLEKQSEVTLQNTKPVSTNSKAWFTNERLNLFLALCAIIISAASFYATYLQANAAERQVKAATWPWLEVMTGNLNEQTYSAEITLSIKNSGSGPAFIKYVKFFYNEKSYFDIFKLIKDCCFDIYAYHEQLNKLQKESPEINFFEKFGWLYTGISNNRLLASGSELNLLGFKKTNFNATQWDKVNDQRFKIKTEICYCSLLEQCYLSDGRGDVKEIQHCEM